jgi:hypothetical protein
MTMTLVLMQLLAHTEALTTANPEDTTPWQVLRYVEENYVDGSFSDLAEQLHYDQLTVDTEPVTKWWRPEDGPKADIADVVVRMLNNSKQLKTIAEVVGSMPEAAPLIDKLNLEVENG